MEEYDKKCLDCGIAYKSRYGKPRRVELKDSGRKMLDLPKTQKTIVLLTCPRCFATNIKDDELNKKYYAAKK